LTRAPGPTANRLFNSPTPFSQALGTNNPSIVVDKSLWFADSIANRLQYVFSNESQLVLDALGDERRTTWYKTTQVGGSGNFNSPFIIPRISTLFGADGVVGEGSDVGQYKAGVLQSQTPGSVFGPFTYRILQAGFTRDNSNDVTGRAPDNFLAVEARPGKVTEIARDRVRSENDPLALVAALGLENLNFGDDLQQFAELVRQGSKLQPLTEAELAFLTSAAQFQKELILRQVNLPTLAGPDDSRTERFFFAAGNVNDGRIDENGKATTTFQNQFAVDRFFVSAGLENFGDKDLGGTVATGIRAFLRNDTSVGVPLSDSGVWVVNTRWNAEAVPAAQNALAHVDFGMAADGKRSTISVTIGEVKYELRRCESCDLKDSVEVVVDGRTVASSRGDNVGTVSMNSILFSNAAGGGNPALGDRKGYAGYLVLENFDPVKAPDGGVEHALGATSADQRYAVLRLATATGQPALGDRTPSILNGWVGGLAEQENGAGAPLTILPIGSGTEPTNVRIQTEPETNRVQRTWCSISCRSSCSGGSLRDARLSLTTTDLQPVRTTWRW
jgi:hypothetical protein